MKVYVEINPETQLPVRILKNAKEAALVKQSEGMFEDEIVRQMDRGTAVIIIRLQVVARARRGNLIQCEFCGKNITENTGHMHEVVPRGKGGHISVDNSRLICPECHIGPEGEHGDRKWGGK